MQRAHKAGMGTIGIRVLAGGALSGSDWRHPLAMPEVAADRLRRRLSRPIWRARSGSSR